MKNKIVNAALTLALTLGSVVPSITAFADSVVTKHTISILENNITYLKSEDGSTPVRMVDRLRDETGMTTFCINFDLPSPNDLEYEGYEQLDNATSYLMDAYYNGNANLTGDKAVDEYIVQATIHNIKSPDSFSLDRAFVDEKGILPRIKALKAEALNAPAPSTPVFENELSFDKGKLSFTLIDGKYESDYVLTTLKGSVQSTSKVVENATPNTKVVDENGNEISTFSNGTKFKVVVPENELEGQAISPTVTAKGNFKNAYKVAVRFGGHPGFQDIASYESKEFEEDKQASVTGDIGAVKGSVKFVKKGTDEKLLDNVKFNILNSDGKVEQELVTKDGIAEATDLSYGLHYLVEVGTLPSYVLNGEKIPFTISHNQETIDLGTVYNKLKDGKIAIHKVDQDGKSLENAEFTLTDENGETEVKTTNKDGLVEFEIEANHIYSAEETKNPAGYTGTFKQENITVENDGQLFEYTAENKIKTAKIAIHKVDQDGKSLENAEFTLTDENGETEVRATNKEGLVEFKIEANHIYSVEETKNPAGYTGSFKQENITVENDGQLFEYTVKNTKNVVVTKVNEVKKNIVKTVTKTFPQTGESVQNLKIAGFILLGLVAVLGVFVYRNKKNRVKNQNIAKARLYGVGGEKSIFKEDNAETRYKADLATNLVIRSFETGNKKGLETEECQALLKAVNEDTSTLVVPPNSNQARQVNPE